MIPAIVDGQLVQVSVLSLREREARGLDRADEIWEGMLHMNPPASWEHNLIAAELLVIFSPLAKSRGWRAVHETGVFDPRQPIQDYRTPDLLVVDPAYATSLGVERRVELAVEIRSPRDEAYMKIPFYARNNVQEYLIIEPVDRTIRRWTHSRGDLVEQPADTRGRHSLEAFPVKLSTATDNDGGRRLRVEWTGGAELI